MAEELPSLHIDTDWKKQAQEEKRKLAEQTAKPAATSVTAPAAGGAPADPRAAAAPAASSSRRGRAARELPPAGLASLVQSLMTQVLYHLGDLASASSQPAVDLDMAKHQLDTLTMLEDKTRNNLTDEEKRLLDAALYETRSRFVSVASQFLGP
jgi:Domain of unknown function (DUF1844)